MWGFGGNIVSVSNMEELFFFLSRTFLPGTDKGVENLRVIKSRTWDLKIRKVLNNPKGYIFLN